MKTFKLADLLAQVATVAGWFTYYLFSPLTDMWVINLYFFLGSVQLVSFFIHLFIKEKWKCSYDRNLYGKFIFWLIIAGLITYLGLIADSPLLLYYLFALLFISPVLAGWYFIIGLKELRIIRQMKLTNLK